MPPVNCYSRTYCCSITGNDGSVTLERGRRQFREFLCACVAQSLNVSVRPIQVLRQRLSLALLQAALQYAEGY